MGIQRREELNSAWGWGEETLRKLLILELTFELALRVESQFTGSGGKVLWAEEAAKTKAQRRKHWEC